MIEPFDYQSVAIDGVRDCFRRGKRRVVLVLPTGGGKTVVAGLIIKGAIEKGNSILFLAHRKELIDQPSRMLDNELGIDHGVIKAKHWRDRPHLPVQVASVQTLAIRGTRPPAKIIFVDEAHRTRARQYGEIFDSYPEAIIIGLTATPARLDGQGLGHIFEEMVKVVSVAELIDRGRLCPPRIITSRDQIDMSDVDVSHGEFNSRQAASKITGKIIGNIVDQWMKHAKGRPTLVFAPSRDKSKEIVASFIEHGIRAAHVDGNMGDAERAMILTKLKSRDLDVVSNVNLLVEGFDEPIVSCVSMAAPTKSLTRWLQICGRGSRVDPSKEDFIILDHAGCFLRLGPPTHDHEWSLDDGVISTPCLDMFNICQVCFTAYSRGQVCPTCGSQQAIQKFAGPQIEETDDELEEVDLTRECPDCASTRIRVIRGPGEFDMKFVCVDCKKTTYAVDHPRAKRATPVQKKKEYHRLLLVGMRNQFRKGWADHRYREVFGKWPDVKWKRTVSATQERGQ